MNKIKISLLIFGFLSSTAVMAMEENDKIKHANQVLEKLWTIYQDNRIEHGILKEIIQDAMTSKENKDDKTLLHVLAETESGASKEILEFMFKNFSQDEIKKFVNMSMKNGETPLYCAVSYQNEDAIKLLVEYANVLATVRGSSVLEIAENKIKKRYKAGENYEKAVRIRGYIAEATLQAQFTLQKGLKRNI